MSNVTPQLIAIGIAAYNIATTMRMDFNLTVVSIYT